MGDEFLTSIGQFDEFHVNLLFDRSIYRPMCTAQLPQQSVLLYNVPETKILRDSLHGIYNYKQLQVLCSVMSCTVKTAVKITAQLGVARSS